jgi:AhpD family alkylhydroperoxidase
VTIRPPGPRIELIDAEQAPLTVRHHWREGRDPGPIVAALAHVPELLEAALPFIGQALHGSIVDRRTAELVIVRSSAVLGCRYCTLTHGAVALDADVTADEIRALCETGPDALSAFVEEREAAMLAWVDQVAAGRGDVPEEVTRDLAAHVDDALLVELTAMVGCTIFLNRFCTTLRLPASDGTLARLAAAGLDPEELAA